MKRFVLSAWLITSSVAGLVAYAPVHAEDAPKAAELREVKAGDLKLKVPATWKSEDPMSQFRLAQVRIPAVEGDKEDGELRVFNFGGQSGGVPANVQRWIGQFAEDGRKVTLTEAKLEGGKYVLAEISGTYNKPVGPPIQRQSKPVPGSRMLAAILELENGGTFFLTLTGPDKTIAKAGEAFRTSFGGNAKKEAEYKLKSE